jgi:hypothetical protein
MTDLGDLLAELAEGPAPSSSLTAEHLYRAGRRRYRRRRKGVIAAAATAFVAFVSVTTTVAVATERHDQGAGIRGAAGARPDPRPGKTSPADIVQWAGAADAQHLYLGYLSCADQCRKDAFDLVGSDDGGRTWTLRAANLRAFGWQVLGKDTVITNGYGGSGSGLLSTDGGRTWSALDVRTTPVAAVPVSGATVCRLHDERGPCTLYAVDPDARTVAPLARQPAIADLSTPVLDAGGRLWVTGADRATGLPAVASSADRGATWSTYVFADRSGCVQHRCDQPQVAALDGRTAYVTFLDRVARRWAAYRAVDGTGWQPLGTAGLPYSDTTGWSFVAADGSHVICAYLVRRDGSAACEYWAVPPAGTAYQRVDLDGLPGGVGGVGSTRDGWFFTRGPDARHMLYGSTDGRHWSLVAGR